MHVYPRAVALVSNVYSQDCLALEVSCEADAVICLDSCLDQNLVFEVGDLGWRVHVDEVLLDCCFCFICHLEADKLVSLAQQRQIERLVD